MAPMLIPWSTLHAQDMKQMPGMGSPKQATTASGTGTVTAVNVASRKITLDHGPMPEIKWPAMKMEFAAAPSVDLSKVNTGDKVRFTISGSGSSYTVQSIAPQ
jgi:Cu/Ag efflux protein CusF